MYVFVSSALMVQCAKKQAINEEQYLAVIPQPSQIEQNEEIFTIDENTSLYVIGDEVNVPSAMYLADLISLSSTFDIPVKVSSQEETNAIILELKNTGEKESYSVKITPDKIHILANDSAGLFYGIQTLRQLLPPAIENKKKLINSWSVPALTIYDKPTYSWRGMHLDVSRHFFSVEFIKQFIDRIALYKFNKLHLHLTDDQGWRLQIKKYPKLTERGAWRILNGQDSACLKRAVTNSDFALPNEFFKEENGIRLYGGYYSHNDIAEIVSYASQRFITVVPEIDMPGHMNAAIQSFPELTCVDKEGWGKLFSIPLCPCEETTYEFIESVLTEVASLFSGEFIHIGADEVDESSWMKSTSCHELMKKEGLKTAKELHSYFVTRVNKIVKSLDKKTIGWDEIIESKVDSTVTVMYWRGWIPDAPAKAAREGHEVIISPTSHCYFDYEPDGSSLEKMYSFNPVPIDVTPADSKKIIGVQANIWTEYIPTTSRLDYMTMPRMIALAEAGWSKTRDWESFSQRITKHYSRLDMLNIHYRLPDIPGVREHSVFIDTAKVILTKPQGVTAIHYSIDGTEPTNQSSVYNEPFVMDSSTILKLLTLGFQGRPGNRYTIRYEKQSYLPGVEESPLQDGLRCRYFEGEYNSVLKIRDKELIKETVEQKVGFPSYIRPNVFALEFTGLIQIPTEGIYTFYLISDDGSTLRIGSREVVNYDGFHSDAEKSGQVALSQGLHPITIRYFDGGGGKSLKLMYEGPSIPKQEIPDNSYKVSTNE